eukprot:scaffold249351_cov84-Cyclotella_meneghiniana.AAC.1
MKDLEAVSTSDRSTSSRPSLPQPTQYGPWPIIDTTHDSKIRMCGLELKLSPHPRNKSHCRWKYLLVFDGEMPECGLMCDQIWTEGQCGLNV